MRVGHYSVGKQIGHGGQGEVYRGRDEKLERDVAIKMLSPHLLREPVSRRRFIQEARDAAKFVHPRVATVFDVVEEEDRLFIIMELIEGRRLSEVIRDGQATEEDKLDWAQQITDALCAIHDTKLIHRDIKPGNIMITGRHVKVMDFGLALAYDPEPASDQPTVERLTRSGAAAGTMTYMSPEQIRNTPIDQRSDLFSLGIVLYELFAGEHPFLRASPIETASAIVGAPPSGGHEPESLSNNAAMRGVLLKLLEKEPDKRYPNAESLLVDLREVARGAIPIPLPTPWWRGPLAVATAGFLLIAAVSMLAWQWIRTPLPFHGPRPSIAFIAFDDKTGLADGETLASMAPDFLSLELAGSRLVRTLSPRRTQEALGDLPSAAGTEAVAARVSGVTTVDYVAVGTLYHQNERYVAAVEFQPTRDGIPELGPIRGEAATIQDLVDELGSALRKGLPRVSALTATRDDTSTVETLTSANDEAVLLFERARTAMHDGRNADAIDLFQKAIQLDRNFALAHLELAQAFDAIGDGRRARESATRAVQLAPSGAETSERRLRLMAQAAQAEAFSRPSELVESTAELVAMFPDDPWLVEMHAEALLGNDMPGPALGEIDRALEVAPATPTFHLRRAGILLSMSRTDEVLAALDEAERLYTQLESGEGVARTALLRGKTLGPSRFEEAVAEIDRAIVAFESAGRGTLTARSLVAKADIEVQRGRSTIAGELRRRAAELARGSGDLGLECDILVSRGAALALARDESAVAVYREAFDLANRLENHRCLLNSAFLLGDALADSGHQEAREPLQTALDILSGNPFPPMQVVAEMRMLDLDASAGQVNEALRGFQRLEKATRGENVFVLRGLAELYERRGELESALEVTQRALDTARQSESLSAIGAALVRRVLVLSALGRMDDATAALDEACAIAHDPNNELTDLQHRCALGRGVLAARRGNPREALDALGSVSGHEATMSPAVLANVRILSCATSGRVETCRAGLDVDRAPAIEVAMARSLLAQTLLASGKPDDARAEAGVALANAERMGLLLPTARAAAVVAATAGDEAEAKAARAKGRGALDAFLAAAPETDREAIGASEEVRKIVTLLERKPIG